MTRLFDLNASADVRAETLCAAEAVWAAET
jgi:hypothetical protein